MARVSRLVPRVVVVVSTTGRSLVTVISCAREARSVGLRVASLSRPTTTPGRVSAANPSRVKETLYSPGGSRVRR